MSVRITGLFIHADEHDVAQEVDELHVTDEGPEGDGLVGPALVLTTTETYVDSHPDANVLLEMPRDALAETVGRVLSLGDEVRVRVAQMRQDGSVAGKIERTGHVRKGTHAALADAD